MMKKNGFYRVGRFDMLIMQYGTKTFHTSRNSILTIGRRIERNSREKANFFSLAVANWKVGEKERALRTTCFGTSLRERKREKCILVRPSLSLTKELSYVPREVEVVLPHWFTEPFVSFLEFLAGNIRWKNLRIAARWFKDLRD